MMKSTTTATAHRKNFLHLHVFFLPHLGITDAFPNPCHCFLLKVICFCCKTILFCIHPHLDLHQSPQRESITNRNLRQSHHCRQLVHHQHCHQQHRNSSPDPPRTLLLTSLNFLCAKSLHISIPLPRHINTNNKSTQIDFSC